MLGFHKPGKAIRRNTDSVWTMTGKSTETFRNDYEYDYKYDYKFFPFFILRVPEDAKKSRFLVVLPKSRPCCLDYNEIRKKKLGVWTTILEGNVIFAFACVKLIANS